MADIAASNSKASSSSSNVHADAFPGSTTSENFTASVKQGTNGSVRLKAGVPMYTFLGTTLVYFTAGVVVSRIDIDYTYSASTVSTLGSPCSFFNPLCATNSFSNFSSHKTRTGFAGGGGVDFKLPGFGPNVVLGLDYTINAFGSYSETATINTATINGFPCGSSPGQTCSATDTLRISRQVYHKPTVALKVGF
jgi:opacity protein-like surface antigen